MEGGEAAGQPASVCQHLLGRLQVHHYAVALGELVDRVWHEGLRGPVVY